MVPLNITKCIWYATTKQNVLRVRAIYVVELLVKCRESADILENIYLGRFASTWSLISEMN